MKVDYQINTMSLNPPIGGVYKFVAKFAYCYDVSGDSDVQLKPPVKEAKGATAEEARLKLEAALHRWIKEEGAS